MTQQEPHDNSPAAEPGHVTRVYRDFLSGTIPAAAWDALDAAQRDAVVQLWQRWKDSPKGLVGGEFEALLAAAGNPGLAYLLLSGPLKYEVVSRVPEDLAVALLAHDATRLDDRSRLLRTTEVERGLDQRFRMFCATLTNPTLRPATVASLLDALASDWHTHLDVDGPQFADLLDYHLWDKWDVPEIPATTLTVLHDYCIRVGANHAAARFTPEAVTASRTD